MNDSKGFYKTLGLKPGATICEVKKAFRIKQLELHPAGENRKQYRESKEYAKLSESQKEELNRDLDEKIARVNEAYNTIGNETKKKEYDSGSGEYSECPEFTGFGEFGDLFSHFTGTGFKQEKTYKVKDTVTDIKITIADVFVGKTNKYKIKTKKICKACAGKGGKDVSSCTKCNGAGVVHIQKRMGMMITRSEIPCPDCSGKGEITKGPECSECKGEKVIQEASIFEVKIPKGIENGQSIKFAEQGNQFPKCQNGDLIFHILVSPDERFSRVENDLISKIDIDLLTAISGGVAYFNHPDGRHLAIKIQPFKHFTDAILVYNEGFCKNQQKGDLYLIPNILINKNIDRNKLAEYIKPLIPNPCGDYQNINSTFGKVPVIEVDEAERGRKYNGFGNSIFDSIRFF